jgi:hypothetical protein
VSTTAGSNAPAGHAAAVAQAFGPSVSVTAKAGHAAGGAQALAPTPLVVTLAPAGHATGGAQALAPRVGIRPQAGHAAAVAQAFGPTVTSATPPVTVDPVALEPEGWDVGLAVEPWSTVATVERWAIVSVVEDDAMHAGDTALPLRIRATFADPDSGQLGVVLANGGITYTVTMELIGADHDTDTPVLVDEAMTVFANDGPTITLTRAWAPGETDDPGRYSLVVKAHVGAAVLTFPSDGRRAELLIEP